MARQSDIRLRRSASQNAVPTTSQLNLGELAINTYDGKLFLKKSVGGTESIVEVGANNLADTFQIYEYSVTSSQTSFSGSDDNSNTLSYTTGSPPRVAVYLNGLLLDWGTDFTATNGTSVVLTSAAASGDLVQIQAYKSTVVAGSNLLFNDNIKAQFGNDGDLEIYHDGSNSIINDTGTGNLQFQIGGSLIYSTTTDGIVLNNGLDVEANEFIGDLRGAILFKAQAGEALSKGDVVYISGISGNTTIVSKADANDANKMPAFGIAATDISSGVTGDIYTFGTLSDLDTSSFTLGDELYVSTTAGALTNSAPTGSSSLIQKIAKVTRSDNSSGSIKIMGAGRSNATPNLDEGKIFVGNASNQSVQVDSTITVDMANSQVLVDGALSVEGGSFASGLETETDVGLVIQKGDYVYSDDNNYLRKIIGHTAANHIEIGQNDTALIGDINLRPGSTGNIKLFGSGSEDFKVDSSGNTTMNGTATINNAVTGDSSQFTILNGAGATFRMGITGSGANEAAHIKTNAGEALEFHIGQASNATTPDIEFLADGAGIDFQGVNILNSSRNMTTNSRFTFDDNDHYLEAGTNSLALKNSGGTSYFVASNTGLSVTGALSSTGDLTVGGNTTITGNLTVNGTTTTLNTATLTVDDLNITLADGAADKSAANGAGITIDCGSDTDATITYVSASDRFDFNNSIKSTGNLTLENTQPKIFLTDSDNNSDYQIINNDGTFTVYDGTNTASRFTINSSGNASFSGSITGSIAASNIDSGRLADARMPTTIGSSATTNFIGTLTGNANTASNTPVYATGSNATHYVTFASTNGGGNSSGAGSQARLSDGGLTYNPSTNALGVSGQITAGSISSGDITSTGTVDAGSVEANSMFINTPDGGGAPAITALLKIHGYEGRGAGIKIRDSANSASGASDREWFIGSGYSQSGFNIGYSATGSQSSYSAQNKLSIDTSGNAIFAGTVSSSGIDVSDSAEIGDYKIDTTSTTTSSTSVATIHSFAAASFRSARYTIQVTNSTDSSYHTTEVLMVHDGTDANIAEYGTIFTANAEAVFDADIDSGNVRLLATPASSDSMTFKVICHSITV